LSIVFRVRANREIGAGHIYNCLDIAERFPDHRVTFLMRCEPWAERIVQYRREDALVELDLARDLEILCPQIVVNDVLDTTEREILIQRELGCRVVCIEDLGPGAFLADWVVNALYHPRESPPHAVWGAKWATLREEFQNLPEKVIREDARKVLIAFGGTDPADLASRYAWALQRYNLDVRVIVGPGSLEREFPDGVRVDRTAAMAEAMLNADLVLTAAGRTVYEAAATGTPVIAVASNEREATHAHVNWDSGVVFLGLHSNLDGANIRAAVLELLMRSVDERRELSRQLRALVDGRGAERIADGIRRLMRGEDAAAADIE
jgi:spore coat polysaccharide biosynthesis predicted glycosyltransferase SpsG